MRLTVWILAAVAAVAGMALLVVRYGVPNLVGSGQAFAGEHAVSLLRTVHWAQGLYRGGRYTDADGDGVGEFGTLPQLTAAALVQQPGSELTRSGVFAAMGYCFRVDLPDGVDARERRFIAVAWPAAQALAGPLVYCIDQDENVLQRRTGAFADCEHGPPAGFCPDPARLPEGWSRWKNKMSVNPVGEP